jgi:hypothetical protein
MKRCGRCGELKSFEGFARRVRSADGLQTYCRSCQHDTYTEYYRNNRATFRATLDARTEHQRTINRRFIIEFLRDHPCVDRGVADVVVLEFDHVRGVKIGAVGAMAYSPVTLAKLKREIQKCDVRCANCHRKRTSSTWRYTLRTRPKEEGWIGHSELLEPLTR